MQDKIDKIFGDEYTKLASQVGILEAEQKALERKSETLYTQLCELREAMRGIMVITPLAKKLLLDEKGNIKIEDDEKGNIKPI